MEPFVRMGGQIGSDIKVWRDLSGGADDGQLDQMAAESVKYAARRAYRPLTQRPNPINLKSGAVSSE